jgi:hypothetical protein
MPHMPSSTVELERQLIVEKEQLRSSLERLGDRASDVVDWRHHVRQRPAGTLGLAVLAGVVVGAITTRPAARRQAEGRAELGDESRRSGGARNELPEWSRLKAGLLGMLADRAIVVAQDFVDRVVPRVRERSSPRPYADREQSGTPR